MQNKEFVVKTSNRAYSNKDFVKLSIQYLFDSHTNTYHIE